MHENQTHFHLFEQNICPIDELFWSEQQVPSFISG